MCAARNLLLPRGVHIRINLPIQTSDQITRQLGALILGQPQSLLQQLLCVMLHA